MTLEPLLVSILFAVTAVAFIGVLNSRGVWRTVVASLLALFCLGTAVFHLTRAWAHTQALAEAPPMVVTPTPESESEFEDGSVGLSDGDLRDLLTRTRALRDSLATEDPTRARAQTDSAYQAFEYRTEAYLAQARHLRESAARIAADPPPGMDEAVEYLNLALQPLVVAARDLNNFFHAENKDEERRLADSFRQNTQAADTPLRQAESRLGNPSPDSAP
jgi:hypothetical protein